MNVEIENVKVMKEKHVRLRLSSTERKHALEAIWFNAITPERNRVESLNTGEKCAFWVSPQWNEWQGVRKLQLRISHADTIGSLE